MNDREMLLDRLEQLQPQLRKRIEDAEVHDEFIRTYGGVTVHQLGVLRILMEDGSLTMNQISSRMHTGASATTQLVDRLVQHGLVERMPDATDRRVQRIVITANATRLVSQFKRARRLRFMELAKRLTDEELQTLVGFLDKMLGSEETRSEQDE